MATARGSKRSTFTATLEQELNVHLMERCRELLQEYTDLARQAPDSFPFSEGDLMTWYAETRYKLLGAGRCSLCGAQVRHAIPVMAELDDNTVVLHSCLCSHCLAAQESAARRVILCVHQTVSTFSPPGLSTSLAA